MKKLLVILGPTATGKTDLALQLARKFQGELVACDSRQVYKGLDIGTGKMPGKVLSIKYKVLRVKKEKGSWEIDGVKIWMYDVVSPRVQYTVADYVKDADRMIREIRERGKLPIIVGGTGLYLKALLEGIPNLEVPVDKKLRKELERLSVDELQEKLKKLSTTRWKKLNESDRENSRRLVRAIELSLSPLRLLASLRWRSGPRHSVPRNDVLRVGLIAPREVLYKKADERVIKWINQGIIEEAEKLQEEGLSLKRMRQLGLEYGVLADYIKGEIREIKGDKGLIKLMQNKIHGYIRRQLTWFKKKKDVQWFDITRNDYINNVEILVGSWYHNHK